MSYISFTILTVSPTEPRHRLIARGILKQVTVDGAPQLVGVRKGVEFVEVPNPIVTTPAGPIDPETGFPTTPEVRDSRKVYLVKLAREAMADDDDGGVGDRFTRSKLVKWVKANGTKDADGYWKVGANFWLVPPALSPPFGAWQ